MKIPETVRIGGVDYDVKIVDHLNNGTVIAYGHISFDDSVIELSGTVGTGHQKRCMTLWHEIIHGIVEHANMDIKNSDEEAIVDTIAKGVYQVLQDNGGKLFDLKKVEAEHRFSDSESTKVDVGLIGDAGKKGMWGFCPKCGSIEGQEWDPETDTCTCAVCGFHK